MNIEKIPLLNTMILLCKYLVIFYKLYSNTISKMNLNTNAILKAWYICKTIFAQIDRKLAET